MTFSVLGDQNVLTGGAVANQGTYTVSFAPTSGGITGIRLQTFLDPNLPDDGPGYFSNGNFVLSEIRLDHTRVPEPSTLALVCLPVITFGALRRRRLARRGFS